MGTKWMIEGTIDPRWPINTRGNIGEVFPEVITALGYKLAVLPAEAGWRDVYQEIGIQCPDDFSSDEPVIIGLYGGYGYLNLSYLRMMGVRAPGSSAEAIDTAFFGEGNPPPYQARKGDKNLKASLKILRTVLKALNTRELPPRVEDSFKRAAAYEAMRPSLDAPDEELLAYMYDFPKHFRPMFANHLYTTTVTAIVSGILSDAATAAGDPGLVTQLIGASGEVRSAQYSQDLNEIAGTVKKSAAVRQAFDVGVEGLLERLKGVDEAGPFLNSFRRFIEEHGHRGPNDWELSARTWDNTPELALASIDVMRRTDHDLTPSTRLRDNDARKQAAVERVRPHLNVMDKRSFDQALEAIKYWSQAREATRDRAVRASLPFKQVYRELVRRAAEQGGEPDPTYVALLDPIDELPDYLADPTSTLSLIAERAALHRRYAAVEPRFFITSQDEVPTIEQLEAEQTADPEISTAGVVLTGDAGSSGVATGRARVILDTSEGADLQPGEILVAPITDPAWTPLFLPAAAVVVNVGALMSHAVIVARELGIPCVVAVEDATKKIRTGMRIEVDGSAGTVRIVDEA